MAIKDSITSSIQTGQELATEPAPASASLRPDPASAAGELATRLAGHVALGPTLDALLDAVAELVDFDECAVALADRSRMRLQEVRRSGLDTARGQHKSGTWSDIMSDADRSGASISQDGADVGADARLGNRFRLAIPFGPGAEVTGAIGLSREGCRFTDEESGLLQALANVAAPRINNCLAEERLNRAVLNLENAQAELERTQVDYRSLFECHPSLLFMLDESRTVIMVNDTACALLRTTEAQLLQKKFDVLVPERDRAACLRRFDDSWGVEDTSVHESNLVVRGHPNLRVRLSLRRIRLSRGKPGMLLLAEDITESWQLQQRLRYEADHDALTGLLNRNCFERRLQRRLSDLANINEPVALLAIDLDRFKEVNDTSGHAAGDELLRRLATLFTSSVRGADIVARLGGDEFAMLLNNCDSQDAHRIAEGVRSRVNNMRFSWGEARFQPAVSIGLVMLQPSDILETAMNAADSACYAAKRAGRNLVRGFLPGDLDLFDQAQGLEGARQVQAWIRDECFELYQQPVLDCANTERRPLAHEVFVRCRHEDSLLCPDKLLPSDDRLGIAVLVDRWVVRKTIEWLNDRPVEPNGELRLVLNLWPRSISDPTFGTEILEQLADSVVPEEQLVFEVPASCVIEQNTALHRFSNQLGAAGCGFGLDSVGADLGLFDELVNLPVAYLKLDETLTSNIVLDHLAQAKVRAIVTVAHAQGMQVGAKKIESLDAVDVLRDIGVDFLQGYIVGRPRPVLSSLFCAIDH